MPSFVHLIERHVSKLKVGRFGARDPLPPHDLLLPPLAMARLVIASLVMASLKANGHLEDPTAKL